MRRLLLTVFALVVLLPSSAFAQSGFLCRLDGAVRAACCCPTQPHARQAPRPTALHRQDCCTVVNGVPPHTAPATQHSAAASLAQLSLLVADLPSISAPPPPTAASIRQLAHAPPPPDHGRDLFVRHCALLL